MSCPRARLEALTDGFFAVTMTLLVLDLKLPEHIDFGDSIGAALDDLLPRFDHCVIRFVLLGMGLAILQAQLGLRTRYASYVYLLLIGAGVVRHRLRMDRAVHAVRKGVSASRE